jgi:hypothetical protein
MDKIITLQQLNKTYNIPFTQIMTNGFPQTFLKIMRHLQPHNHKYLWKLTYVKRVLTAVNGHIRKARRNV